MQIIFIHGYLAHRSIWHPMARRLRKEGFMTLVYGYPSHRGDLADHAQAFAAKVNEYASDEYAIVAHSMGGLIVRGALSRLKAQPKRIVFVSTPHRGCARAKQFRQSVFSRWMSPAVKQTAYGLDPPKDTSSWGIVLGSRDKVVSAEEGAVSNVPTMLLPYGHNEILWRPRTSRGIANFVRHGVFESRDDNLKNVIASDLEHSGV
ncbi:MAG: alpha/beta fold hydrolase [Myxococcota bacterium]|nr:alpha/beta fold hydrolase [Myxococcota bacterium]